MARTKNEAPAARDPQVIRMRKARRGYAIGRLSFRKWARHEYGGANRQQLSPKLSSIVHGAP